MTYFVILLFEVLFYSLFIKFVKPKSSFIRLLMLFAFLTLVNYIIGSSIYAYIFFVILALLGLKYFVKTETTIYDLFIIVIMILFKAFLEIIDGLILQLFFENSNIISVGTSLLKTLILFPLKDNLLYQYRNFNLKWKNNNFYVRYIFTILIYVYVIFSLLFLINE